EGGGAVRAAVRCVRSLIGVSEVAAQGVEVPAVGAAVEILLLQGDVEAVAAKEVGELAQAVSQVVDFQNSLFDLPPVSVREAGEDFQLALLDIDLEQVDTGDPPF